MPVLTRPDPLSTLSPIRPTTHSMWAVSIRRWSDYLVASGHAERTIRQYRRTLVNFLADTLLEPENVTEDDVTGYIAALPHRGHLRGNVLRALRSYYFWAERHEPIVNPVERLKVGKPRLRPAPFLTEEELTRLIIAAAWREPRRAWAIILLYCTGMRLESACNVKPEDVRDDILYIRVAKGDRPYTVPLNVMARAAVDALWRYDKPTLIGVGHGRLWQWVHEAGMDAGIRAFPHLLRHSFATHLIERGVDVRTVQELGGWADLSQIPRYAAVRSATKAAAVAALDFGT